MEIDDVKLNKGSKSKPKISTIKQYDSFLAGPIPLGWLLEARRLGPAAFFVGVGLWYHYGLRRRPKDFKVGIMDLSFGVVSRPTVKRGLKRLISSGLADVSHNRGQKGIYHLNDEKFVVNNDTDNQ